MNTQALKDMLSKLNAKAARDTLVKILDHLDGTPDGQFDAKVLEAKVSAEISNAAAKAVTNPLRALGIALVASAVSFAVGFASHAIFFCK